MAAMSKYAYPHNYAMWMELAFARAGGDAWVWTRIELAYYELYGESLWA